MLKLLNQTCAALDHNFRCLNKESNDQRCRGSRLEHQFRRMWVQHSHVISKVSLNLFPHLLMMRWKLMTSKAPLAIGWPAVANLVNRMCTCTAWAWRKHTQMIPEVLSTSFSAMVQGPSVQFFAVTQVMSNSLQLHGLQHARAHYSSSTPTVYANSYPLSLWCHPTISSSVVPFSSCLQSFPASGLFQWVGSSHQVATRGNSSVT